MTAAKTCRRTLPDPYDIEGRKPIKFCGRPAVAMENNGLGVLRPVCAGHYGRLLYQEPVPPAT